MVIVHHFFFFFRVIRCDDVTGQATFSQGSLYFLVLWFWIQEASTSLLYEHETEMPPPQPPPKPPQPPGLAALVGRM